MYDVTAQRCTLLNFGGQQFIGGDAKQTLGNLEDAYNSNSSINGVGITMEGIWTNYPIFEMTLQAGYEPLAEQPSPTVAALPAWFRDYGVRRYGKEVEAAVEAWTLLGSTVYSGGGGGGSAISSFPTMPAPPPAPPTPPPHVAGFHVYSQHGYFGVVGVDTVAAPTPRASIASCGQLCLKTSTCKGFEVYVDTPPAFGNCYFFKDTTTPFTVLPPCATYIRVGLDEELRAPVAAPLRPYHNSAALNGAATDPPGDCASASTFAAVYQKLVSASPELGSIPSYRFDLVDVAREVISSAFTVERSAFVAAFNSGSEANTTSSGAKLLQIIDDYDLLLSSDTNFQLGRWLAWVSRIEPSCCCQRESARGHCWIA